MSARERKPPSYLEGAFAASDKEFNKQLKEYQKKPIQRKKPAQEEKPVPVVEIITLNVNKGAPKPAKGTGRAKKDKEHVAILTPQQRIQEEIEERHIARGRERKARASKPRKVLPEGAVEMTDIESSIKRGVKECSTMLLDWTSKKARMIGYLCKVYWDGENQWFYARILNYDSFYDRHYVRVNLCFIAYDLKICFDNITLLYPVLFHMCAIIQIYYLEDSTAEWISLEDEIVLVAEQMVLARLNPGGAPWAAQRFWISEKAHNLCLNFVGFHKGGACFSYFMSTYCYDVGILHV